MTGYYKDKQGVLYTVTRDQTVVPLYKWQVNRFDGGEVTETFWITGWSSMIDFLFDKYLADDKEPAHYG